ncbi:MAG: 50S ribosomal protein L4 [Verrucomicrobia bacterium]|nr:50S ribosomal protein L4 [Verrucomicrobiota bacterium]
MATLKKFDISGKEIGSIQIDDQLLEVSAHSQMIKDYIVAIRNNARQWSASTKGRSEINRTGKKPHPQKGQGRSRQGCLAAPQYKGGGIVFGPKPKFDQHVRINRKERRAAIRFLIAEKIKENQIRILDQGALKEPKTKKVVGFFEQVQIGNRRTLVLGQSGGTLANENFVKSLRNIPKKEYMVVPQVNGYELARCQELVVLDSALDELLSMLG